MKEYDLSNSEVEEIEARGKSITRFNVRKHGILSDLINNEEKALMNFMLSKSLYAEIIEY